MHHDHALAPRCDVDRSGDSVWALHSHFPQLGLEMLDVGLSNSLEAVRFDQMDDALKTRPKFYGQGVQSRPNIRVKELDGPSHKPIIPFLQ
jgi:hypothetical protein